MAGDGDAIGYGVEVFRDGIHARLTRDDQPLPIVTGVNPPTDLIEVANRLNEHPFFDTAEVVPGSIHRTETGWEWKMRQKAKVTQ